MIFTYLAVFIVALILANIFIVAAKPKKKAAAQGQEPAEAEDGPAQHVEHPEVITALQDMDEKHSLVQGSLRATNQKLGILNSRLNEVEKAVSGIIEMRISGTEGPQKQDDADYEKIDFRIRVLEDEIDKLKSPKHAPKTFYGKVDPDTEKEIRSLVFNSKKA